MDTTTPIAKYAAAKNVTLGGRAYKPGDPVDTSKLPVHKVQQFLRQRILRPVPE